MTKKTKLKILLVATRFSQFLELTLYKLLLLQITRSHIKICFNLWHKLVQLKMETLISSSHSLVHQLNRKLIFYQWLQTLFTTSSSNSKTTNKIIIKTRSLNYLNQSFLTLKKNQSVLFSQTHHHQTMLNKQTKGNLNKITTKSLDKQTNNVKDKLA